MVFYYFIIYNLTKIEIFHNYYNIHYHFYDDDMYYISSSNDSDMIQIYMFNCITDLTEWLSHNSIFLNMTKTDTIILSRPSCTQSSTHHFYNISSNVSIYNSPWFHDNLSYRILSKP